MGKALLVVDMQKAVIGRQHLDFFKYDDNLLTAVNQVIQENETNLVVYIRNIMKKNLLNKFAPVHVYEGTEEAGLAEELLIKSDYVFDKYEGNAFSNQKLHEFLRDKKIHTVEIAGVDGGGCVARTAMGAVENGYRCIINTKAVGTMMDKKQNRYYKKLENRGVIFI